jgi:hypothetical protein
MTAQSVEQRLRTPQAAAVAGILFALICGASIVLARLALPEEAAGTLTWSEQQVRYLSWTTMLAPFAGIAFLWFLGVIRDRLGALEDQFFSTVFFGSGLLFIAMMFTASALAGSTLATLESLRDTTTRLAAGEVLLFGRAAVYQTMNIYAIRMAGVFMLSLSTIWLRTGVMPRPAAYLTSAVALLLLIVINLTLWTALIFPLWVLGISLYILLRPRLRAHGPALRPD